MGHPHAALSAARMIGASAVGAAAQTPPLSENFKAAGAWAPAAIGPLLCARHHRELTPVRVFLIEIGAASALLQIPLVCLAFRIGTHLALSRAAGARTHPRARG